MTVHRYAARRDANEDQLLELAERLGANIQICGPLDFWVGHRGKWTPCECKAPKGKYTAYQQLFIARSKAAALPVWTWRSPADVLRDLGAVST